MDKNNKNQDIDNKFPTECDHYYPRSNTGRLLACEFCNQEPQKIDDIEYGTDNTYPKALQDDEDYDDRDECCEECGCYHGHHSWCRE